MQADVNNSGRLTLDEFAPVAVAVVGRHLDEVLGISTLLSLFGAFDADCDGRATLAPVHFLRYLNFSTF